MAKVKGRLRIKLQIMLRGTTSPASVISSANTSSVTSRGSEAKLPYTCGRLSQNLRTESVLM